MRPILPIPIDVAMRSQRCRRHRVEDGDDDLIRIGHRAGHGEVESDQQEKAVPIFHYGRPEGIRTIVRVLFLPRRRWRRRGWGDR
jgi:hypothetical protein